MRSPASMLVICLAALATSPAVVAESRVPGGWSKAPVKDPGVIAAASFAIEAAKAKAGDDASLTLVEILAAEQQVVAGMNYRLTLKVKQGDDVKTAEATVWARVWLEKGDRYQLTAWRFLDEAA